MYNTSELKVKENWMFMGVYFVTEFIACLYTNNQIVPTNLMHLCRKLLFIHISHLLVSWD